MYFALFVSSRNMSFCKLSSAILIYLSCCLYYVIKISILGVSVKGLNRRNMKKAIVALLLFISLLLYMIVVYYIAKILVVQYFSFIVIIIIVSTIYFCFREMPKAYLGFLKGIFDNIVNVFTKGFIIALVATSLLLHITTYFISNSLEWFGKSTINLIIFTMALYGIYDMEKSTKIFREIFELVIQKIMQRKLDIRAMVSIFMILSIVGLYLAIFTLYLYLGVTSLTLLTEQLRVEMISVIGMISLSIIFIWHVAVLTDHIFKEIILKNLLGYT